MFSNCKVVQLSTNEKEWLKPFKLGQKWIYVSDRNNFDTLNVVQIRDELTPCNRLERSEFQFNLIDVSFESNRFGHVYMLFTATESGSISRDFSFSDLSGFYYGNEVNKCIDKIKIKSISDSVVVYTFNQATTGDYGFEKISSFSWSKEHGIVRYITRSDSFANYHP